MVLKFTADPKFLSWIFINILGKLIIQKIFIEKQNFILIFDQPGGNLFFSFQILTFVLQPMKILNKKVLEP